MSAPPSRPIPLSAPGKRRPLLAQGEDVDVRCQPGLGSVVKGREPTDQRPANVEGVKDGVDRSEAGPRARARR